MRRTEGHECSGTGPSSQTHCEIVVVTDCGAASNDDAISVISFNSADYPYEDIAFSEFDSCEEFEECESSSVCGSARNATAPRLPDEGKRQRGLLATDAKQPKRRCVAPNHPDQREYQSGSPTTLGPTSISQVVSDLSPDSLPASPTESADSLGRPPEPVLHANLTQVDPNAPFNPCASKRGAPTPAILSDTGHGQRDDTVYQSGSPTTHERCSAPAVSSNLAHGYPLDPKRPRLDDSGQPG